MSFSYSIENTQSLNLKMTEWNTVALVTISDLISTFILTAENSVITNPMPCHFSSAQENWPQPLTMWWQRIFSRCLQQCFINMNSIKSSFIRKRWLFGSSTKQSWGGAPQAVLVGPSENQCTNPVSSYLHVSPWLNNRGGKRSWTSTASHHLCLARCDYLSP